MQSQNLRAGQCLLQNCKKTQRASVQNEVKSSRVSCAKPAAQNSWRTLKLLECQQILLVNCISQLTASTDAAEVWPRKGKFGDNQRNVSEEFREAAEGQFHSPTGRRPWVCRRRRSPPCSCRSRRLWRLPRPRLPKGRNAGAVRSRGV